MMIITGGTYGNRDYSCMYDQINIQPNRYEQDLIGLTGIRNGDLNIAVQAMLWFKLDNGKLNFVKGELYFPAIDKTYSEILEDLVYDLDTFEPTDNQGYDMVGLVTYKGKEYNAYGTLWDTTTDTWEEAIVTDIAAQLAG